jgi:hypothetical protein
MKQTISLAIITMLAIGGVSAKDNNQAGKSTTVKGADYTVTYEQLSKNGRVIFGKPEENPVLPYGKFIDDPTKITLKKDVFFGSGLQPLKAGTYSLLFRPVQGEWLIMVTRDLQTTAANANPNDKATVALNTNARVVHLDNAIENYTMKPEKDGLLVEWDKVSVLIPIVPAK